MIDDGERKEGGCLILSTMNLGLNLHNLGIASFGCRLKKKKNSPKSPPVCMAAGLESAAGDFGQATSYTSITPSQQVS